MSLFYLCFKDLLGTKPIQKTLLGWFHILNKRSVDSQLRKWPKHHNEYLSRAHRYANDGLCYFHWQSGLQTETKARFYWDKMLKPRSKKEQGFCLRIWNILFETPLSSSLWTGFTWLPQRVMVRIKRHHV